MRTAGIVIFVLGIVGTVFYGIKALDKSGSFQFLGMDIAVSSANWTPVIISAVLLIIGLFMMRKK